MHRGCTRHHAGLRDFVLPDLHDRVGCFALGALDAPSHAYPIFMQFRISRSSLFYDPLN